LPLGNGQLVHCSTDRGRFPPLHFNRFTASARQFIGCLSNATVHSKLEKRRKEEEEEEEEEDSLLHSSHPSLSLFFLFLSLSAGKLRGED